MIYLQAQERAAKQAMAEKAKEFKRLQKEAFSKGLKPSGLFWIELHSYPVIFIVTLCFLVNLLSYSKFILEGGSFGSSATGISSASTPLTAVQEPVAPRPAASTAKAGGGKVWFILHIFVLVDLGVWW